MSKQVASYKLGSVQVQITETDDPQKLRVQCNDGNYRSEFTIRRYEYNHYKRHMNQRITKAFNEPYDE